MFQEKKLFSELSHVEILESLLYMKHHRGKIMDKDVYTNRGEGHANIFPSFQQIYKHM